MKRTPAIVDRIGALRAGHGSKLAYLITLGVVYLIGVSLTNSFWFGDFHHRPHHVPPDADRKLAICRQLNMAPGPPEDFWSRAESDRWVPGTLPTLVRNSTIWVGRGEETLTETDFILNRGLIKRIGKGLSHHEYENINIIDARGAWVTPSIFDLHSHLGVYSSPELSGASDGNSFKGVAQPWLRALDGLNTHDDGYRLAVAGGTTAALVLPGSAGAIGGQAFPIKLRPTSERSSSSMVLEPPYSLNGTDYTYEGPPRWRHMKHACGENPSRIYGFTRMDTQWAFRNAYNEAKKVKEQQDVYCEQALAGKWHHLGEFPENLQWESLVDVLRGRVKVNNHCYEAVDFDGMVRLSNEFKFSISAFHHAFEAYLVPDLLKKMYGTAPALAIFSIYGGYKREMYRGSEFTARILADNGLQVIMKSDHPGIDSQYLLHEAQQAYYYGLGGELALASVTTTPAEVAGFGHRLGYIKPGYDADLVIWDSHPLALGATPQQVFVDGIPQLSDPFTISKHESLQVYPKVPNFDKEAADAVKYEGLPPLKSVKTCKTVLFTNVKQVYSLIPNGDVARSFQKADASRAVLVKDGRVISAGHQDLYPEYTNDPGVMVVDLEGGIIAPGLTSYGSLLGLEVMRAESSTGDGIVPNALFGDPPSSSLVGGDGVLIHAVDGLAFETRIALLAYRAGVTTGVTPPTLGTRGFIGGLSVAFDLGASHALEPGAIHQSVVALHVTIDHYWGVPSVSTQIAALRSLLLSDSRQTRGEASAYFAKAARGQISLIVKTENADVIATLIRLKEEVESAVYEEGVDGMRLVIEGASESHLVAKELADAGIGVILTRVRTFPLQWEGRRILPGLPLSKETTLTTLLKHNVTVAIGTEDRWAARNARFEIGWAIINSNGTISPELGIALGSTKVEQLLGFDSKDGRDSVAYRGGDIFEMSSKVAAILSERRGETWMFI